MTAHESASRPEPTTGSHVAPTDCDLIHGEARGAVRVVPFATPS